MDFQEFDKTTQLRCNFFNCKNGSGAQITWGSIVFLKLAHILRRPFDLWSYTTGDANRISCFEASTGTIKPSANGKLNANGTGLGQHYSQRKIHWFINFWHEATLPVPILLSSRLENSAVNITFLCSAATILVHLYGMLDRYAYNMFFEYVSSISIHWNC